MSEDIQATLEAQAAARVAPVVKTKEEKLADIDARIAKLQARRNDIENDVVKAPKVKKAAYVPAVGDRVIATIGRNTATSQSRIEKGIVRAIKIPAAGEKGAIQVRVEFGEGFDTQLVTLYPAQLQPEGDVQQANAEAAEAASMGSIATNPDAAPEAGPVDQA